MEFLGKLGFKNKSLKPYSIILAITLMLAAYNWLYKKYFYEITYARYLSNYEREVVFPTYTPGSDIPHYRDSVDFNRKASDDELSYIPFYGKAMFYLSMTSFIDPILFLITFITGCAIFVKMKMYLNYKWWIVQIILYCIILLLIFNTEMMD